MRLIRANDLPPSHALPEEKFEFGLQDTKGVVVSGTRGSNGEFIFDLC